MTNDVTTHHHRTHRVGDSLQLVETHPSFGLSSSLIRVRLIHMRRLLPTSPLTDPLLTVQLSVFSRPKAQPRLEVRDCWQKRHATAMNGLLSQLRRARRCTECTGGKTDMCECDERKIAVPATSVSGGRFSRCHDPLFPQHTHRRRAPKTPRAGVAREKRPPNTLTPEFNFFHPKLTPKLVTFLEKITRESYSREHF